MRWCSVAELAGKPSRQPEIRQASRSRGQVFRRPKIHPAGYARDFLRPSCPPHCGDCGLTATENLPSCCLISIPSPVFTMLKIRE